MSARFNPSSCIFETTVYDYETLHRRMREQAFLNAGVRILMADRRPGREAEEFMHYEGVYTTSRAGFPVWACISTGTPRPLSVTRMASSSKISTVMWSQ